MNYRSLYILVGLLALISLLHYMVGGPGTGHGGTGMLHGILGHLYLVPILLAAYWFGIKGGVSVSIISALLFSPHLFQHWHDPFLDIYNYVEIFLFLLIGGITGVLSQMERNQRLRYEEAIKRLDDSHRKLREQTDILFQTEEQLRRADRLSALGTLSAGVAHEIRNPLGAIKGAAEILQGDYGPGDPKQEFVQILLKETDRLNGIVQDFLDFARPRQPEFLETDINDVLEGVLSLTAQAVRKGNITVERKLDRLIARRHLDAGLLKQAFLNIILNAVQAMPRGGMLTVQTTIREGKLQVLIADSGIGISPENRAKLFSPFFTTKKDGTGLGLAITYRIIQNHGGTIDVSSEAGRGSIFTISLPARQGIKGETA
ncbi:MAG: ATP-binding protein [Nitrospirota bacterium]|nr:ATP-binding protein [Nitrospirota bacterium]